MNSKDFLKSLKMPCSKCHLIGHNRRTCPCIIEGITRIRRNVNGEIYGQNGNKYYKFKFNGNKYSYCEEDHEVRNSLGYPVGFWINHIVGGFPLGHIRFIDGYVPPPLPLVNDPLPANDPQIHITLRNMKNENYLVYWVIGNNLIMDLDENENDIRYLGILLAKSDFKFKTLNGHRIHLVPHSLTTDPPYHPPTDKTFFIPPYVTINIYPEIDTNIYIDDKDKLSDLNKWKFNALKLDYLMKELIKLGGMNYDSLEPVLDLHQDILLDDHDEYEKDRAGIPSVFTNVT